MNIYDLDTDYVEPNRSQPTYRTYSSDATPPTTASQVTVLHAPLSQTKYSASSSQPTVIPYCPSPPSTPEIYGPDRLYGTQPVVEPRVNRLVNPRPLVRFDEQQLAMAPPRIHMAPMDFRDELTRSVATSVTPGIDDRDVFQYALDVLTQPREDPYGVAFEESSSDEANPMFRYMPGATPGLFQPSPAFLPPLGLSFADELTHQENVISPEEELAARRKRRMSETSTIPEIRAIRRHQEHRNRVYADALRAAETPSPFPQEKFPRHASYWQTQTDEQHDPRKAQQFPPLTYKPWMLRAPSLILLAGLCTFMIAALIFCAVYSSRQGGLMAYSNTIYDGYYFVFRILPQFLAALLLVYAQGVIATALRVLPFALMTSDDIRHRRNVGFLPLYQKSFLWPQLVSTWHVWIPIFVTWLLNFSIPLQSSLFTLALVDGHWRWSTVQGVAWVLVALYVLLLLSTCILIAFWHNRRTGFKPDWDLRSLADIIALIGQSNSLQPYRGTETVASRTDMRHLLYGNIERLGYWSSPECPEYGMWYGIGIPTSDEKIDIEKLGPPIHEKDPRGYASSMLSAELENGPNPNRGTVRNRYLPWCFRNSQMSLWVVAASILLIALLVVSFYPSTELRGGFLPGLSAAPAPGAFSAANFLYSFVPSLLGMVLFLMFQSLDLTLRILTPWGELSRQDGSRARTSILADYAACLPLQSTWKALKNHHWRVAFVSLLSTLFFMIPVLAGGLFIAMTPPSGAVRMYPQVPVFAILLTLLVLYLVGLISLVPNRKQFRLPHAVTCLSEIISFCSNEELRTDDAFDHATSRMKTKGNVGAYADMQSRWCFGTGRKRDEKLGIKRYNRYTADHLKAMDRANRHIARDGLARGIGLPTPPDRTRMPIGRPNFNGSSSMVA